MRKIRRYLSFLLLIILCVSFFLRKNIHSVTEIHPLLFEQPLQETLRISEPFEFQQKGYLYRLTPLYDYEIAALIVSKIDYSIFSIYKYESIFSVDLCLVWGENLVRRLHQNDALSFKQDCRWCWAYWKKDIGFNMKEFANTHLLITDPKIERKVDGLLAGDQVIVKGKLVDVEADLVAKKDDFTPTHISWSTSESREDTGAGSCEVLYVEDVVVLKRGNPVFRWLYIISACGLALIIAWNIINFFRKDSY